MFFSLFIKGVEDGHGTTGTVPDGILMTIFSQMYSFTAAVVYYAILLILILKAIQYLIGKYFHLFKTQVHSIGPCKKILPNITIMAQWSI